MFKSRTQLVVAVAAILVAAGVVLGQTAMLQPPVRTMASAYAAQPAPIPAIPRSANDKIFDNHRYVGTGSCAASNCHGGSGSSDPWRSEYSIWIQEDPHSTAYTLLYNALSQQIAERLDIGPAHRAEVCLNCHTVPAKRGSLVSDHRFTIADGVACEACHGPAEHWLERHKEVGWSRLSAAQREELGFRNTDDIATRARMCADCHVGSPGRDVNHDLIAAGHPPLKFELAAYHARLPKHWRVDKDRRENAMALEATLWATGQLASAEAAAQLLEHRAGRPEAIWPEFAEYDCFACHHQLPPNSWRQMRGYGGRRPGALPWGHWYPTLVPIVTDRAEADTIGLETTLESLRTEMERPLPSREKVQRLAGQLEQQLGEIIDTVNQSDYKQDDVRELMRSLAQSRYNWSQQNWDSAAQVYLGSAALHRSLKRLPRGSTQPTPHAEVQEAIDAIRIRLKFPTSADGVKFESPAALTNKDLAAIQKELETIHTHLSPSKARRP